MNAFPRILLVTPGAIDFPFGSGEILRKIVDALPRQSVCWASLKKGRVDQVDSALSCRVFPLQSRLNWRLQRGLVGALLMKELWARKRARSIAKWAAEFGPKALWILAEEDAVSVGYHLRRITGIPAHLTFHDAPEILTGLFGRYHRLVEALYMRRLGQLIRLSTSLDAVCSNLVSHVGGIPDDEKDGRTMVFPFSLHPTADRYARLFEGETRRIGFCGSLRTSREQWASFLAALSALPFRFEFVAFVDKEYFPDVPLPTNVRIEKHDFMVTEDVVRTFIEAGVCACYLGLYRDAEWSLFCRTSLSSKLTAYAATGAPVIVNGPEDSVVWHYVRQYGAGVRFSSAEASGDDLGRVFTDADAWSAMAKGVRKLFESEFNIESNIERFKAVLRRTAGVPAASHVE